MKVGNLEEIEATPVRMEGAQGVRMRIVIGEGQGAPNFVMRVFDVDPGGHTPYHTHDFEHEVFVLEGHGTLLEEGRSTPLGPGDVVYVPPGALHRFLASDEQGLRFICVVPRS
ncbi:cupin domain-containing protein [Deferrisoma camini]|uniref:cupin domain-containing protein n=1 Tax=Deferrisoma camini TaxID=1035120 RepID=UPI00046CD308|nr:cupin domain-containing protein [Deferrisoma camini]